MTSNEIVFSSAGGPATSPTTVELIREGYVGNIQTFGVCTKRTDHGFEADVPAVLCVGEEVQAALFSSDAVDPVRASARVIYRNQNRYGFFFRTRLNSTPGSDLPAQRTASRERVQ